MKIGDLIVVDEIGTPEKQTCEFHVSHDVYPLTRRQLVVHSVRQEPDLWTSGWSGQPEGSVMRNVYTLRDAEGVEWTKLTGEGVRRDFHTKDGRSASLVYDWQPEKPTVEFANGRKAFVMTDTTGTFPVQETEYRADMSSADMGWVDITEDQVALLLRRGHRVEARPAVPWREVTAGR